MSAAATAARAVKDAYPVTYEHHHVLEQLIGKPKARALPFEIGKTIGCTYCGAAVGEVCRTDSGLAAMWQHKARRSGTYQQWMARVWEITHEIVEQRAASQRADVEVRQGPRLRPKLCISASGEITVEQQRGMSVAERIGASAARLRAAREADDRAWREAAASSAELADAEREMRESAAMVGVTDIELLLRGGE